MASARPRREWVDWTQPMVPAVARWLQRAGSSRHGFCELDNLVCVTPGKRAGRVILEALLRECESQRNTLLPPRFITPGALPEVLAAGEPRAIASPEESRMAWIRALQDCDPETIRPLIPRPAARDDLLVWTALARILQAIHDELAGALLSFENVVDRAARLEFFGETDRWTALARIHREYLSSLASTNLHDRHLARIESLINAQKTQTLSALNHEESPHIILIGVTELNALQRLSLAQTDNITALIHAPAELADHFDNLGCAVYDKWTDRAIDLREEQIIIADKPDDQAQAVLDRLAASHQSSPIDTITIGLGDDALAEPMERAAAWANVSVHRAESKALSRSAPFRLLEAVRDWIAEERFAPFAALLRHPDIERWLTRQCATGDRQSRDGGETPTVDISERTTERSIRDWLSLLDRYFTGHLHRRFAGDWLGDSDHVAPLKKTYDSLRALASSLLDSNKRLLADWIHFTLEFLQQVYFDDFADSPTPYLAPQEACLAIREALEPLASIAGSLQPRCDAATALTLLLDACAGESLSTHAGDDEIEVLSWLELHLDAAPNVIVIGVNDGSVPKAITSDPFLPDTLRKALGLQSNLSRYARDAYLLEAMNRSRNLTLIAGRRGPAIGGGDPLTPSRLLLACDSDKLAARILRLSDDQAAFRATVPLGAPQPDVRGAFIIYRPPHDPEARAIERMTVTSFKRYLQCPFRWLLQTAHGLEVMDDAALELDPLAFGEIAHDVLEAFAREEIIRDRAEAESIAQWLHSRLARVVSQAFGDRPPPAVRIQIARLHRRLEAFARFQARTRADGWRIVEREMKIEGVPLEIPGQQPVYITGKIDRIDELRVGGAKRYRIIDYKTSENPDTPFQTHHGKKSCDPENWIDLQLPLYRHLATHAGFTGDLELGYIVLPRDVDRIGFLAGKWNDEDYEAAIECARDVVRRIRAGEFPMSDDVDARYDEFANICQTNVRGRAAMLAAERAASAEGTSA